MSGSEAVDRRADVAWHMKKEVNITTILAVVGAILTGSWAIFDTRDSIGDLWKVVEQHMASDKEARMEDRSMDKLILTKLDSIQKEVSDMKEEQAFRYGKVLGAEILKNRGKE